MTRLLLILAGILGIAFGIIWLTWYLAFALPSGTPSRVAAPGLEADVNVGWCRNGTVYISARSLDDGLAGLGFAQTWRHAWHLTLLRQVATGRLSEWFGEPTVPLDELAHWLNLPDGATEAFESLDEQDKQLLTSFSTGINVALERRTVSHTDEFVLLGIMPERWDPWHTIAVERLIAWMATPAELTADTAGTDYNAQRVLERRTALKNLLHLHGFEQGAIISAAAPDGDVLALSQVYGSTALSLFQDAELTIGGSTIRGVTLVGTPFFVFGSRDDVKWATVLNSSASLPAIPRGASFPDLQFARTRLAGGQERITAFRRTHNALFLADPVYGVPLPGAPPPRQLEWAGFTTLSDAPSWLSLLRGSVDVRFGLIDGPGVLRTGSDQRITGPARYRSEYPNGIVISPSDQVRRPLAKRLTDISAISDTPYDFRTLIDDVTSPWAQRKARAMIATADTLPRIPPEVADVLMYLRNWDFRFDEASIGASVFDTWHRHYIKSGEPAFPPGEYALDRELSFDVIRTGTALVAAIESLEKKYGTDRGLWRWEVVQPNERFYPVFSDSALALGTHRGMLETRYAPIRGSRAGHPTTIRYGPAVTADAKPAPAVYRAWLEPQDDAQLYVSVDNFHHRGFLGRYLVDHEPRVRAIPSQRELIARTLLTPQR